MAAIMERDQSIMEIMERSGERLREMGTGEMERDPRSWAGTGDAEWEIGISRVWQWTYGQSAVERAAARLCWC